jgi:hypothetical protein
VPPRFVPIVLAELPSGVFDRAGRRAPHALRVVRERLHRLHRERLGGDVGSAACGENKPRRLKGSEDALCLSRACLGKTIGTVLARKRRRRQQQRCLVLLLLLLARLTGGGT